LCQYCSSENPMSHHDYVFNPQKGRREFILDSMAAAMGGLTMPSHVMASDKPFNEVVKIGCLPITDASAL